MEQHKPKDYVLVFKAAVDGIVEKRDPRALRRLTDLLSDDSLACEAASALGRLGDAHAVEPLATTLGNHERHARVRAAAATSLGMLDGRRAVEPLIGALGDPKPEVRAAAARALGRQGNTQAVQPLVIERALAEHAH